MKTTKCSECEEELVHCEYDDSPYCRECNQCAVCEAEERRQAAEYAWMAGVVRQAREGRDALGLPSDASDSEVMAAAREVK